MHHHGLVRQLRRCGRGVDPRALEHPHRLVDLRCGGHQRELDERRLSPRRRDPHQRPHLGVAQPALTERGCDHRQVLERPRHPDVLAACHHAEPALPRQPLRHRRAAPLPPRLPAIELGHDQQKPARRRRQLRGQRARLGLQPLRRHRRPVDDRIHRQRNHQSPPHEAERMFATLPEGCATNGSPRRRQRARDRRVRAGQ